MFLIIHSGSFPVSYQLCSCQGSVWNDPSYKAGEGQPGLVLFGGPGCQTPPDKNPELLKRAQAGERLSLQHDIMVKALKCGSDSEHRGSNVLQGNNSRWVSCYSRITHTQGEVIQVCAHQGNLTERRINYFAIKGDKNTQMGIYWRTADVLQVHSLTELCVSGFLHEGFLPNCFSGPAFHPRQEQWLCSQGRRAGHGWNTQLAPVPGSSNGSSHTSSSTGAKS